MTSKKKLTAEEFDAKFDAGEDITDHLDLNTVTKRVNVDFPVWMIEALNFEAKRMGLSRQAIIKMMVDRGISETKKRFAEHPQSSSIASAKSHSS